MLALSQNRQPLRGYMVLGNNPRRRTMLGAITPDQAAQTVMPTSAISSKAGFTQAVYNAIVASAQSGAFSSFNPAGCPTSSGSSSDLKLIQTGSGLALTGATIGLTAAGVATAAALAPFTMGISALIGLLPLIFGHHAQAVAKEQQVECALVPAAQNYLDIINQAVTSGQQTPAQGIAALQSLLSDFQSQIASITKNSASQCNAGCTWTKELQAIVAYETSVYEDMENQQTVAVTSGNAATPAVAAPNSGSTLTIPTVAAATTSTPVAAPAAATSILSEAEANWLPIAALVVGAIVLMKVI